MQAGECVTLDQDFGRSWNHFAAVRQGPELKLYVNGMLRAVTSDHDAQRLDVNNSYPLLIGFGAQNYLTGALDDLRLYQGALTQDEVRDLLP